LDPAGKPIANADPTDKEPSWSFTIFKGVIAAGMGTLWPDEKHLGVGPPTDDVPGVVKTQKRHMRFFMQIFGLCTESHRKQRELVGDLFKLPITTLENSRKKMNQAARAPPPWKIRGELGRAILESINASQQTFTKLLTLMRQASKNHQRNRNIHVSEEPTSLSLQTSPGM
jgi:hypothetical protein